MEVFVIIPYSKHKQMDGFLLPKKKKEKKKVIHVRPMSPVGGQWGIRVYKRRLWSQGDVAFASKKKSCPFSDLAFFFFVFFTLQVLISSSWILFFSLFSFMVGVFSWALRFAFFLSVTMDFACESRHNVRRSGLFDSPFVCLFSES